MNIKSGFLTLSMREQICLAIIFLTAFCICVTLCIFGSLSYEILKVDYNQKKLYFYDIYKEYIESSFYFQNFYLLEYEEIIKRIQKQIWVFYQTEKSEIGVTNYNRNFVFEKLKYFFNDYSSSDNNSNDNLYLICFPEENMSNFLNLTNEVYCGLIVILISYYYETLSSLIFMHNIEIAFRLPGLEMPIIISIICSN